MKYDLFISDYDGTLGKAPANNIDSETLSAINEFIKKGGVFAVCSGRETSSIMRILKENDLKGLVVSFQGARISDIESGKRLLDGGLDVEITVQLIKDLENVNLTPLVYSGESFFYREKTPYIEIYEKAVRIQGRVETDMIAAVRKENLSPSKICWLGDDKIVNQMADEMNEKFANKGVKFNSGAPCLLEAIKEKYNKGAAVRYLSNYYNIPLDKVIAVGDSTNDIDLLKGEWHGVAVGDGREELKAVAKEVTVPFDEKPVKVLLEKYCL